MKLERIIYTGIIAALVIIILFQQCNRPAPCPDVTTTTDTVYIHIKDTTSHVPKPVAVVKKPATSDQHPATSDQHPATSDQHPATSDQKPDCSWQVIYSDTINKPYGQIIIDDTVSNTQITGRTVTTNLTQQQITITKVKEVPLRRTQLYAGVNFYGNKTEPLYGAGPALMLKTKTDKILSAGAVYTANGWIYTAGYHFKISFRR